MTTKQYVLLDRDGTIIREKNYLASPDEVELLPGAARGLRRLQQAGYGLIVITNQSGVGRGYLTEEALSQIHWTLEKALGDKGVRLDAIYYCPHTPEDNCACRKPKTEMAERAAARFAFNVEDAVVIGDKPCDIELGQRCGNRTILVRTGYGRQYERAELKADFVCDDLMAAADALLARSESRNQ